MRLPAWTCLACSVQRIKPRYCSVVSGCPAMLPNYFVIVQLVGRPNFRHKKTGARAGLSGSVSLVETYSYCYLVPRGRLELPLLSKTDFESAASTIPPSGLSGREF